MKEGNVLFNNTLNTFYLRLYGDRHMVKDHSDSEIGNLLPPHGLLFPISSNGSFICIISDRITHTTAFVTPVVEHWLEREIAQWVLPMKDRSNNLPHHERTLLPRSYISLPHRQDDRRTGRNETNTRVENLKRHFFEHDPNPVSVGKRVAPDLC